MTQPVLYDYWRSSASYRVRIALNLADIDYQSVSVDLVKADHKTSEHLARNPQGLVPVLNIDGHSFTQSMAIIDYLNTTRGLGLLPDDPAERAHVQALAQSIAVDIHPVCNSSVVAHVSALLDERSKARENWMDRFITPGLAAFEELLKRFAQQPYCTGRSISIADLCLIPQLYNADRWGASYKNCQRIQAVARACEIHPAFIMAHPDAVKPVTS